ncbi:hypothetical protein BDY19DRAFT_882810 [Irpex rosettiformis]|uniref:Uncharacterized protein n=1 Tax=Irpex rosettiformis TaxID=378272 RepID=A0ACB8UGH5_9APHY|nr:hypothetical protein BDY19DRAFT_882810 [Irpex rosettiformis]
MLPPTTRIDGASLVDPALHHPAIIEMLNSDLSRPLVEHIVDRVIEVVDFALGRPSTSARGRSNTRRCASAAEFAGFARQVIERAGIGMPGLLGTLVYLDRAKPHLQLSLEEWACERVFLGALICSNKYLNDSTLKNVHWSMCTGLFNRRDIGRIEREFLDVLDFEMRISEADILVQHKDVVILHRPKRSRVKVSSSSPLPSATTRPPFRHRADSDSSAYSDDSTSSDSLPATPPSSSMDVDAHIHSPSPDDSSYSDEEEDLEASVPLPRLRSSQKEKAKDDPQVALPRFSSALNLLRVPRFHGTS